MKKIGIFELTGIIRADSFWRRLFSNLWAALAGETGSSLFNVLTTLMLVRLVGDTSYGMFVLAQNYMVFLDSLINFQSWQAVIKYGTEYIEKKDYKGLAASIKIGMMIDLVTALLGAVIAMTISSAVGVLMKWDPVVSRCCFLFSIEIFFHFSGASIGVLRMMNHFRWAAAQKVLVSFAKCLLVAGCSVAGKTDILFLTSAYVALDICGHILLTLMCFAAIRLYENLTIRQVFTAGIHGFRRQFWSFAFWTNLTSSMDLPVKYMDVFIMSSISYEMVAVYKVYKQIGNILVQVSVPISQAILPQFSELVAQGRQRECWKIMMKLHRYILIFMIPLVVLITLVSPWALGTFFGERYAAYFYVLTLYLAARTFSLSYTMIHPLFISMGLVRLNFLYTMLSNLIYLTLAVILTRYLGILGLVISLFAEYLSIILLKKQKIRQVISELPEEAV